MIIPPTKEHIGVKLSEYDCYIATGGGFEISDPSSDLAVAISLLSSLKKYSMNKIIQKFIYENQIK